MRPDRTRSEERVSMAVVSSILYSLSAVALLYACMPPQKKAVRRIARPAMFVLGVLCYLFCAKDVSVPVVIALAFLCAGGILMFRQDRFDFMKAGYACYSAGLLLYAFLCLRAIGGNPSAVFAVIAVLCYSVILFFALYMLLPFIPQGMAIYVCVLTGAGTLFSLCALLLTFNGGSPGSSLLLIGSLFWLGTTAVHLYHRYGHHIPSGRFLITLLLEIAFTLIVFGSVF